MVNKVWVLSVCLFTLGVWEGLLPQTDIAQTVWKIQEDVFVITTYNAQYKKSPLSINNSGILCVQEDSKLWLWLYSRLQIWDIQTFIVENRAVILAEYNDFTIVNTDLSSFSEDIIWRKKAEEFREILDFLEDRKRVVICIDRNTLFPNSLNKIATDFGYSFTQNWNTWILENSEHLILRILWFASFGRNGFSLDAVYVKWWKINSEETWKDTWSDHISLTVGIDFK